MNRKLIIVSALILAIFMPSLVSADDVVCPVPAEGECVFEHSMPAVINPYAENIQHQVLDQKYLIGLLAVLAMHPDKLALMSMGGVDMNNPPEDICSLKAICLTMDYGEAEGVTWLFPFPVNLNVHEETAAQEIPVIMDFRGPEEEKLTLQMDPSALATWPEGACAFNLNTSNGFLGGTQILDAKFDGLCILGDNNSLDEVDVFGSGDDGVVIEGDNNTITDLNSSYNGGDGVELSGSNNTIDDAIIINNGGYGINNLPGAVDNSIDNAYIAGNAAGNILDEDGSLRIGPNVKEECPPGFQMTQIGWCRRECPTNEYDYYGECVLYCPIGFEEHASGFCLKSNMIGKFALPYTPDPGSSDGCSLIPVPFNLGGLAPYLLTLIPIGPFVIFRRKRLSR